MIANHLATARRNYNNFKINSNLFCVFPNIPEFSLEFLVAMALLVNYNFGSNKFLYIFQLNCLLDSLIYPLKIKKTTIVFNKKSNVLLLFYCSNNTSTKN